MDRPLQLFADKDGNVVARDYVGNEVLISPATPPAPAPSGTIVTLDRNVRMFQTGSVPGGRALLNYQDAKVRSKAFYTSGGLTMIQYLLAMTGPFIDTIPDIDVMVGGEFEWELPYGHIPGWDGYFTFAGNIYYADHPHTMTCEGRIRTEAPNVCIASLRVDMFAMMELSAPGTYGEEKGVLNRRRPFLKWTPGSWIKWTVIYPTE